MDVSTPAPGPRRSVCVTALAALVRSEHVAELCWWYLVCVAATSAAKLGALASVYRHSDGFVLDEMAAGSGAALPRPLLLGLVLARDLVQTGLLAGCVFLLAAAFSPHKRSWVYRTGAVLLALVMLGNHVAFMQLGTFASSDVLATAWGWVRLHPQSLWAYVTPGAGLVLLLSIAGVLLPAVLVRGARRYRALASVQHGLPVFALVLLLAGLLCAPLASARFGERAFPVHGYWADVASAAWKGDSTTPLALAIPQEAELLKEYEQLAFSPPPSATAHPAAWKARQSSGPACGRTRLRCSGCDRGPRGASRPTACALPWAHLRPTGSGSSPHC